MESEEAFRLFTSNVRRLLAKSGMNQDDLAEKMKVSSPSVSRMLDDEKMRMPRLSTLTNVANALGVDVCELLCKPKPKRKSK